MLKRLCLVAIFYFALVTDIHFYGSGIKQTASFENSAMLFISLLALFSFFVLIDSLNKRFLTAFIAFAVGILFYYTKRLGYPLSYNLIINNIDYFKHTSGLNQISSLIETSFVASDFVMSLLFSILMYLSYFFNNKKIEIFFKKKRILTLSFLILSLSSCFAPYTHDPVTALFKSAYKDYVLHYNFLIDQSEQLQMLPPVQIQSSFNAGPSEPQNIFLVIVESFNSRFINQKMADGTEYTPYFNQLTKKHLYLENYFSNSVYTSKGQFSALCGQVPMLKRTEYKNAEFFNIKCLPDHLKKLGYVTYFTQADPNFNTDNTKEFMLSHGFDHFLEVVKNCSQETERCYGLGIKDSSFYHRVFNEIDSTNSLHKKSDKPFFVTISTVSSHMPFNYLDVTERQFYKNPKDRKEHYLNFLNIIDDGLKSFFTRLEKSPYAKNSIVIVTDDHGFPLGEHGSFHNASYAYQENFGVPFLIFKNGNDTQSLKEKYAAIEKRASSHLNLAPTVLDLAGYNGATEFVAKSIFNPIDSPEPVYLIQPYGGGYLAVIDWPLKYIFSMYRYHEWVYNLAEDPGEKKPLDVDTKKMQALRTHAAQIYKQQKLYSFDYQD